MAEDNTPRLCLVSCRDRLCPRCAHYRGRRVVAQLSEIVRGFNAPRFLTLTIRSRSEPLADTLDRLARAFRRLRRTPEWAAHVVGGVYAIEVTYNPRTSQWHPHLHLIFDGSYWPQRQISALWDRSPATLPLSISVLSTTAAPPLRTSPRTSASPTRPTHGRTPR